MTEPRATYTTERRRVRPMTARQAALLRFIIRYKCEHDGNSPTIRQMMRPAGITSTSIVNYNLRRLEQLGHITMQGAAAARSIAVTGGRWVYEPTEAEP